MTRRGDVSVDRHALDLRRDVSPSVFQNGSKVIGGMAGERVLEIEKAEVGDAFTASDEHDIFRVIISKHGHGSKAIPGDGLQNLDPRRPVTVDVHFRSDCRTVPLSEQLELRQPLFQAVWLEAGHRCMLVQVDEDVGRKLVKLPLPPRIVVQELPQSPVPEIGEQEQSLVEVARKDLGRTEADRGEPFGDRDERTGVLVRRRRIHQDRGSIPLDDSEIAAERRVPGQRQDLGSRPAARSKEFRSMGRRFHLGGHRPSHDGGTLAVKILSPSDPNSSDRVSASGHRAEPARSGHSTSNTASAAESRPSSPISDEPSIR